MTSFERAPVTRNANATFSQTVLSASSLKSWKTTPTLRRRYGIFERFIASTRIPSTVTSPSVGVRSRYMRRRMLDFPIPDEPMRKTKLPFSISRLTLSSARTPFGYTRLTPRSRINFGPPLQTEPLRADNHARVGGAVPGHKRHCGMILGPQGLIPPADGFRSNRRTESNPSAMPRFRTRRGRSARRRDGSKRRVSLRARAQDGRARTDGTPVPREVRRLGRRHGLVRTRDHGIGARRCVDRDHARGARLAGRLADLPLWNGRAEAALSDPDGPGQDALGVRPHGAGRRKRRRRDPDPSRS